MTAIGSDRPSVLDVLANGIREITCFCGGRQHLCSINHDREAGDLIASLRKHDIYVVHISEIDEFPRLTVGADGRLTA